jgi:pectate lyase
LNGGTTGGNGGTVVTVSTQADLESYAAASGKYVIKVKGKITISPFGKEINVASDKTIVGIGSDAEIYQGGLHMDSVHNIIIRNLKIGRSLFKLGLEMFTKSVWIRRHLYTNRL